MAATELTCPLSYARCAAAHPQRAKPTLRSRLVALAIALALGYGVYNGERWLLGEAPASANELAVATCMADIVFGGDAVTNACVRADTAASAAPQRE